MLRNVRGLHLIEWLHRTIRMYKNLIPELVIPFEDQILPPEASLNTHHRVFERTHDQGYLPSVGQ